VERADRLDVVFADALGTGKIPNSSQGLVVLPAQWEHHDTSQSPAKAALRLHSAIG
jgi:hypothetical protein